MASPCTRLLPKSKAAPRLPSPARRSARRTPPLATTPCARKPPVCACSPGRLAAPPRLPPSAPRPARPGTATMPYVTRLPVCACTPGGLAAPRLPRSAPLATLPLATMALATRPLASSASTPGLLAALPRLPPSAPKPVRLGTATPPCAMRKPACASTPRPKAAPRLLLPPPHAPWTARLASPTATTPCARKPLASASTPGLLVAPRLPRLPRSAPPSGVPPRTATMWSASSPDAACSPLTVPWTLASPTKSAPLARPCPARR
mmetsp:Transcript_109636/g.153526  ORF Transcript_109636/g.153526 Transcript_109636/m.153526 type:complete len:263 (-) Transcript_109636:2210-2998(-)